MMFLLIAPCCLQNHVFLFMLLEMQQRMPALGTCMPQASPVPPVVLTVQGSSTSLLLCLSGQNEGTISVAEGEMLYVIEEDKGDGWTRIRRNEDEEGYVPTSYVEVYLDKNAKGAMTYI